MDSVDLSRSPPLTKYRRGLGFTTIELALVIAGTALIVALLVSALHTYTVRKQVAASLALAAGLEDRVIRAFQTLGVPPADWRAAGFPVEPSDLGNSYIDAVDIVDGRIELKFGERAHSVLREHTLSLTPFETADLQVVWVCGNRAPGVGLKPLGFASGANQAEQVPTTIDARYLPKACY